MDSSSETGSSAKSPISTSSTTREQNVVRCRQFRILSVSCLVMVSFLQQHQPCQALTFHPSATTGRRDFLSLSILPSTSSTCLRMVSVPETLSDTRERIANRNNNKNNNDDSDSNNRRRVRKKYKRKRIPETERERRMISKKRQDQYEKIVQKAPDGTAPSVWSFESLFPKAVWDEAQIEKDLYGVSRRDKTVTDKATPQTTAPVAAENDDDTTASTDASKSRTKLKTSAIGATSMMRVWRDPKSTPFFSLPYDRLDTASPIESSDMEDNAEEETNEEAQARIFETTLSADPLETATLNATESIVSDGLAVDANDTSARVNFALTRMVEDRIYGYRRGTDLYDTSLMGDGAVKFREGVRLGNPLRVNADRLNFHAKKEFRSNRLEEAAELYEEAIRIDPRDGRAYLGLARCAERRRDFKLARELLRLGIAQSVSCAPDGTPDTGANPFLLQTLGCLEEKAGHLSQAESLYVSAVRSRPSHAASWVALAQLRTRKLRQSAAAGRVCFQSAERELQRAGMKPSAWIYTAWASMEYKKCGDVRRARQLFKAALKADKRCSAAWLQLGVMEADNEHWKEAELCFETVLKFDQRNTRVLQAYAIMESKRPQVNTRKVIGLFERALKVNPRDAGVLQPYALFVARLGDIDAARELLKRGTEANKRHAPVWQAWGVMETREGNPEEARNVFQQGIWACAQLTGGQSGGYSCARLWQAWGVLEASEGDYAAARRCFSRALDADNRNMAATTAWTLMEEELGEYDDARHLYERSLLKFAAGTVEKKQLWRSYELMEQKAGNDALAQEVYRRSMRESFNAAREEMEADKIQKSAPVELADGEESLEKQPSAEREVEVVRWDQGSTSMKAEIWLTNDGDIESMVPKKTMNKRKAKAASTTTQPDDL